MEYDFGYIIIRFPYTPYSIYLRGTIYMDVEGYVGRPRVQGVGFALRVQLVMTFFLGLPVPSAKHVT